MRTLSIFCVLFTLAVIAQAQPAAGSGSIAGSVFTADPPLAGAQVE